MNESASDDAPGFWATVRDAVRGVERDLTHISLQRAVVMLAVPTVLEMSMESLLTIVDIFFVARLGPNAVATVGLTESILSPVYALAMGISAGATAIIARRTGEKDPDGAAVTAVHAISLAALCALVMGAVGVALSPRMLAWMGAEPGVIESGASYTAVMIGGSVTIFLLFVVNGIFRSAGDAAVAMRSLWVANILNMGLAPCLIFGLGPFPKLGLLGAAVAMTGSRAVGVLYQVFVLVSGTRRLRILARHLALRMSLVREVTRIATPATLQVLIETASWLALTRILSTYGSFALAGYTIAMRIAIFALLPSWGLASAAATLVGQNLGAKQPERARASVWTIARYNLAFLGPVGLVFVVAPGAVVAFFTRDASTAAFASDCLRIVAVGFIAFAFGMVTVQAFNGAGDTRTPMLVNLGAFWFFKIPLAWLLAKVFGMGPRGAFLAITLAYGAQSLVSSILFRRGRWMHAMAIAPSA